MSQSLCFSTSFWQFILYDNPFTNNFFSFMSEAVIVAFCSVSYFEVVGSRTDQIPTKADFLASLLPLICIPAVLSLGAGLFKWYVIFIQKLLMHFQLCCFKDDEIFFFSHNIQNIFRKDDNWKLSRGAYMFIIIGLLLLLGAISAIIVTIKPWAVSDHPL